MANDLLSGFAPYDFLGRRIKKRRNFKVSTKRESLSMANYKCQKCKSRLRRSSHKKFGYVVEFDHWDNNSSNNSLKNCKVLCPTCHAQLTVIKKRKISHPVTGMKSYQTIKKYSGIKKKRKRRSNAGKKKRKTQHNQDILGIGDIRFGI